MEAFDFVAYQQSVREAVVRSCQSVTESKSVIVQLDNLAVESEQLIEKNSGDRSKIDCGPGCSSCCVVNVSTLMPEGLAISAYLKKQEKQQLQRSEEKLDKLWWEVRGLDDDDRLFVQRPCAFLDKSGCCSIYPVRPLLCRSITSTSAAGCSNALSGKLLGEETAVLMNQYQQTLYEALFSAVAEGLQVCGLDGRSFQLAGLVRYLLKHPEAEAAWLSGHKLTWQDLY